MTEQLTFEARLADAYEHYLASAPIAVDARAMAASAAAAAGAAERRGARGFGLGAGLLRSRLAVVLVLAIATLIVAAVVGSSLQPVVVPTSPTSRPVPTDLLRPTPLTSYEGVFTPAGTSPSDFSIEFLVELADGRVLGLGNSWPERKQQVTWDPVTGRFTPAGLLAGKRQQPIAVRLRDGRVLILGGDITEPVIDAKGGVTGAATYSTAELFDPATGTFTPAGPLVGRGWAPTAIALSDGRVLIMDGISVDDALADDPLLATAEIYDPATDRFTATGSMVVARGPHPAVLLADGRVLVTGGRFPETGIAEVFDPASNAFSEVGRLPDPERHPAGGQYWPEVAGNLVLLPDGRVLVAGRRCQEVNTLLPDGHSEGWYPTAASIFDPATDTFTATDPMPHCIDGAYALRTGEVLLTSFWQAPESEVAWSGIYDPGTGAIRETGAPPGGRYMRVLPLSDGRVLCIGMRNGSTVIEVFQ